VNWTRDIQERLIVANWSTNPMATDFETDQENCPCCVVNEDHRSGQQHCTTQSFVGYALKKLELAFKLPRTVWLRGIVTISVKPKSKIDSATCKLGFVCDAVRRSRLDRKCTSILLKVPTNLSDMPGNTSVHLYQGLFPVSWTSMHSLLSLTFGSF
jgi:hypothetical protein